MNSNYQVTVLGPSGRRTIIKVTPSTSILQIIEETCAKQKLDANIYNAKHLRRILDASSTIQFSNVPNKAQLELVELSVPRKDGIVTVILVTETGQRLTADFSSTNSLLDILNHHEKEGNIHIPDQESGRDPVLVYIMRKITAKEFETTSLKSLGLFNGKCMFRYNIQNISPDGPRQANVSGPLIQPKKETPALKPRDLVTETDTKETTSKNSSSNTSETTPVVGTEVKNLKMSNENEEENKSETKCDANEDCSLPDPPVQDEMITEVTENIVQSTSKINVPVVEQDNEMEIDVPTEVVSTEEPEVPSTEVTNTCDFKEPRIVTLGSHNAILFNWDDAPSTRISHETDDFFELSMNEVKKLYHEQIQQLKEFDDVPLMTTEMRQLERDSRLLSAMNKHPLTQLRICFPDRNVIQASFRPRNTIQEVMDFIRPFLAETDSQFSLYTIMPKTTLDPKLTLVDADCIPNARLFFEGPDCLTSFLSEDTLLKKSSFEGASRHTSVTQNSSEPGSSCSRSVRAKVRQPAASHQTKQNSTKKPKWFKLGK